MKQQPVIHISGPPGAGKTTLGKELQLLYPKAIVKDTDDFATNLSQEDGPLFIKQLEQCIQSFIEKNTTTPIILVGILDVTHEGIPLMVNMKQLTSNLFYLEVPSAQLLRQFYTRIVDIGKNDPVLWEDIAEGRHSIPSSQDKLKDAEISKKKHLDEGYQSVTRNEIMSFLKQQMLCNYCNAPAKVECSSCSVIFCGSNCSAIDPTHKTCVKAAQYLRYVDTNYIFGTKNYFTLWRESQMVTDASGKILFQLTVDETEVIFKLLQLNAFHKRSDTDKPQCCDIPYLVIEYGGRGDWVANMDDVPALAEALLRMYENHDSRFQQSRMRVRSSMK